MMRSITNPAHVKAKLAPVIKALRGIDGESVGFDGEVFEICAGLLLWMEGTVAAIDAPQGETAEAQPDPTRELVAKVGLRVLTLKMMVGAENRLLQAVIDQFERDLAGLKFAGATVEQVNQLENDAKVRTEAHRLNISDLAAQKTTLEEFLSSTPDCNLTLLAGTDFEQPLPMTQ